MAAVVVLGPLSSGTASFALEGVTLTDLGSLVGVDFLRMTIFLSTLTLFLKVDSTRPLRPRGLSGDSMLSFPGLLFSNFALIGDSL
jgi:hypothetical protein